MLERMDTTASAPIRAHAIDLARTIILVQGAILVAATIESFLFAAAFGPAAGIGVALTAGAAILTLVTAARLGAGRDAAGLSGLVGHAGPGRRIRRWTIIAEGAVIATFLVDLGLAIVVTGAPIGLVALMTRLVAPLVVIALVRGGGA